MTAKIVVPASMAITAPACSASLTLAVRRLTAVRTAHASTVAVCRRVAVRLATRQLASCGARSAPLGACREINAFSLNENTFVVSYFIFFCLLSYYGFPDCLPFGGGESRDPRCQVSFRI